MVQAIPAPNHGRALGLLFAANGLGLALGPVLGGLLVSGLGWRAVFLLNVPLILLSFSFCNSTVPASVKHAETSLNLPGWLLMCGGLIPLLVWTSYVTKWGAFSLPSLLTLLLSFIVLAAFFMRERRTAQPVIAFDMLRSKTFAAACLLSVLLAVFYCSAFMLLPFRLSTLYPLNDASLGLMLLPLTLIMALTSPLAGRLSDKYSAWPVMATGFTLLMMSALLLSLGDSLIQILILAMVLMGAGWAAILGPSVAAALAALPLCQGSCRPIFSLRGHENL